MPFPYKHVHCIIYTYLLFVTLRNKIWYCGWKVAAIFHEQNPYVLLSHFILWVQLIDRWILNRKQLVIEHLFWSMKIDFIATISDNYFLPCSQKNVAAKRVVKGYYWHKMYLRKVIHEAKSKNVNIHMTQSSNIRYIRYAVSR